MTRTREQLGLTAEQATTPIHVNGELWTLLKAARYLYSAHRDDDPNRKKVLGLATELARLRRESQEMEDMELIGAADALEQSAREILTADA